MVLDLSFIFPAPCLFPFGSLRWARGSGRAAPARRSTEPQNEESPASANLSWRLGGVRAAVSCLAAIPSASMSQLRRMFAGMVLRTRPLHSLLGFQGCVFSHKAGRKKVMGPSAPVCVSVLAVQTTASPFAFAGPSILLLADPCAPCCAEAQVKVRPQQANE